MGTKADFLGILYSSYVINNKLCSIKSAKIKFNFLNFFVLSQGSTSISSTAQINNNNQSSLVIKHRFNYSLQ